MSTSHAIIYVSFPSPLPERKKSNNHSYLNLFEDVIFLQ